MTQDNVKIKCKNCVHLRRMSEDKNRWSVEQSTCTAQRTPLGTQPARWPDTWRMCPDYQEVENPS